MKRNVLIVMIAASTWACEGKIGVAGEEGMRPASADEQSAKKNGEPSLLPNPGEETTNEDPTAEPSPDLETDPETEPEVIYEVPEFTNQQILEFARGISRMLVSRPLNEQETATLSANGLSALEPMLRAWASDPEFAENARFLVETHLKTSGQRDDIDMNLPGNLVAHIVRNDLPWSTVLTADYCVDAAGSTIECDSGAPFVAGVLSTRAYLATNASRFNLGRALTMMEVFACRIYPMEADLQPYLEKEQLIPMFQANSPAEQTVAEAAGGFGNGNGCYTCHGQFGAHAQLFVKFDETGVYRPEANGLQDPDGELGRSVNGLMTSHMNDPIAAADEGSQVFGQQVGNLAEAARTLASSEPFLDCQAEAVLHHVFGLPQAAELDHAMIEAITESARAMSPDPTFADLVVATFTEPRVILSVVGTGETGGTP